jgi:two-component system, LytTR family, response regulator LytT
MYHFAIVEDDQSARENLLRFFERYQKENGIAFELSAFASSEELLALEESGAPLAALFLDIELPGKDGMSAAKEIRAHDQNVEILFITNLAQYALEGYEVMAFDFIKKPIGYGDFALRLGKLLRRLQSKEPRKYFLKVGHSQVGLALSDIYYVESFRHELDFHTKNGVYKVYDALSAQAERLGPSFAFSEKSYLINLAHVGTLGKNEVEVAGDKLPLSRNYRSDFLAALTRFLGDLS